MAIFDTNLANIFRVWYFVLEICLNLLNHYFVKRKSNFKVQFWFKNVRFKIIKLACKTVIWTNKWQFSKNLERFQDPFAL